MAQKKTQKDAEGITIPAAQGTPVNQAENGQNSEVTEQPDFHSIQECIKYIQTRLKAPKDKYNSFSGFYYRSAEGILEAIKPLLEETGCSLNLSDEIEQIGDRYYVKATACLWNGYAFECATAYAREDETKKGMDGAQITGSASSYARKYALNGLLCIDDAKDPDTDEFHTQTTGEQPQQQPSQPASAIDREAYLREIEELPNLQAVQNWWKQHRTEMPQELAVELYDACKARMEYLKELNNRQNN